MDLPPHYHSELYALVNELEEKIPSELSSVVEDIITSIKKAIVKLGVKSQAPGGHFYSPVVNPNSLSQYYTRRWESRHDRNAVKFVDIDKMRCAWNNFLPHMKGYQLHWRREEGKRYFLDNIYFGISDASILVGILNHFKPRRYFEIGSGFSSALALDIAETADWDMEFCFVEPYPEARLHALLSDVDRHRFRIEKSFVQDIPLGRFQELGENDILFVDSTHVAKSGSDVVYIYTEILNNLSAGVIVHVHDIFFPFDYPPHWVIADNRSWNEAYMLNALLLGNTGFEVIFFNDAFGLHERELIAHTYPEFLGGSGLTGGSIWLRKVR